MIAVIEVGNTDNSLTQQEWHEFVEEVHNIVRVVSTNIYFSGGPPTNMLWQNYCWVLELFSLDVPVLKETITSIRKKYKQDSVAFILVEQAEFI